LKNLKTKRIIQEFKMIEFLTNAIVHNFKLVKAEFIHFDVKNDYLFKILYNHIMNRDCCNCDFVKIILRM
jgi:hypothetical protein